MRIAFFKMDQPGRGLFVMDFRWAIVISLWTLLAGPVFDSAGPSASQRRVPSASPAPPTKITANPSKKNPRAARVFRVVP